MVLCSKAAALGLLAMLHRGAAVPCADASAWETVFADEFEGTALNASSWTVYDNRTHGPTEKQLYVAGAVSVRDGALRITTARVPAGAPPLIGPDGVTRYNYTSGWVEGRGKVFHTYGRIEVRAMLPSPAAGAPSQWPEAWPAHWLMPEPTTSTPPNVCWPVGGELDIMEGYRPRGSHGATKYSVLQTYHWATECGADLWNASNSKFPPLNDTETNVDFDTSWHTYALEWTADALVWFLDDAEIYRREAGVPASLFVPADPFYVILNTALTPWTQEGDPGFPVEHIIDSVVWCQRKKQGFLVV